MESAPSGLSEALRLQAQVCDAMGSPFHAALGRLAAEDLDAGGPTASLMAAWLETPTRQALEDAAPLRLLGAIHDLALSPDAPALAARFPRPGAAGVPEAAWREFKRLSEPFEERLRNFIAHEPQTNEVMRSACLAPGFIAVARETGLPLRLFELGASAGLNQVWDRFAYDYGAGLVWGDAASGVRLAPERRGAAPRLDGQVSILSRAACDRAPVSIADPLSRRRLRAYIWPDQFERLARLDAAVDIALASSVAVAKQDALGFVEQAADPRRGAATVIYHSIFWQYLPAAAQAALTTAIQTKGGAASADAPLGWLRMEPHESLTLAHLTLTLWPGGEERLLAKSHPHGQWIEFVAT